MTMGKRKNSTIFRSTDDLANIIDPSKKSSKVAMINFLDFNPNNLPKVEKSNLKGIRLAFHKKDLTEALKSGHEIKEKGYEL